MNSINDATLGSVATDGGVNQGIVEETIVFGDNMLPFLDDSVVFKGLVDSNNGAIYLDPVSFAALVDQPITAHSGMTFKIVQMPVELLGSNDLQSQQENIGSSSSHNAIHPLQVSQINQRTIQNCGFPLLNTTNTTQIPVANNNIVSSSEISPPCNLLPIPNINGTPSDSRENSATVLVSPEPGEQIIEPPIGKGPFRCQICGKEFPKWPQFRRHKAEHLDEKVFRCRLCPMTFNFEANLDVHTMVHEAESTGILQCQLCPTKFSRLASLKSHLRIHETEENLVCQECGDEFPTKARLETHLEEHKTRHQQCMLYRCRLCSKTFTQAALLKDHSKEHAAIRNQLKVLNTKKRRKTRPKLKRNISDGPSTSNNKADKAAERLEKRKQQQCSVCQKRFEKPSQLVRHVRIHTGEKPFGCNLCDKRFNQKGTLETHIQAMHNKVKPFKCHLCSVEFSQRGNLKAHVLKVHVPPAENEKVFKCEECPCVYRRLATLNNHIAKAHTKASEEVTIIDDAVVTTPSSVEIPPPPTNTCLLASNTNEATIPRMSNSNPNKVPSLAAPLPNSITIPSSHKTSLTSLTSASNVNQIQVTANSTSIIQDKTGDGNITEVKLAHDTEGKSRRCVVKVKKVGHVKWHMCPFCEKAFRKPSDLIRHIRIHTQEKPYACHVCDKSFAVKSTLITHVKTHYPRKPDQECRICHKRFSMLSSLKAHERLHTGAKPFVCMHIHCGRAFRTSCQRRMHYKIHTRNVHGPTGKRKLLRIGDITPQIDLPDPLKITSEGLVPVPNRSLQSLILKGNAIEGKGRPYKCQQCPAAFKKSSHLKQHVRSHTGERPYKCFQCFRNFVSSGVLKNHIKTHEGVRAFKCNICNISFTTNGSLTRHMATHTSSRPFVCPYCHKTWKTSVSCRKHIKTHRSEIVAFHSVDNQSGEQDSINFGDDFGDHEASFDEGIRGVVASVLGGVVSESNVNLLEDPSIASVSDNVVTLGMDQSVQPMNQCLNLNQHSLQDINNLIAVGGHSLSGPNGEINIQYSSVDGNNQIQNPQHHSQINVDGVPVSNVFDSSVFTIEGEHLELPPTNMTQFVSHTQQEKPSDSSCKASEPTTNPQIISDDVEISEINVLPNDQPHMDKNVAQNRQAPLNKALTRVVATTSDQTRFNRANTNDPSKAAAIEKDDIQKIREFSQSISEAIYHDLKTQDHSKPADPVGLDPFNGKVNACHICTRAFRKRSDLQRHIRIHTGEKPFRCQICGKAFRVKSTKEAHMRTHEGGKTVSCHICNNLFSTKSSLRVHMRLHTGDKPYSCPHCERCFRTSGHRKAHVQSHFKISKEDKVSDSNATRGQNATHGFYMTQTVDGLKQNCQMLPPVQTIKDKSSILVNAQDDMGMAVSFEIPGSDQAAMGSSDPVHVIGSLQLTMEGPTIQNIQITSLDLNSLPIDENFLQNLGNVIFMTPGNISALSQSDLNSVTGISISTPVVTGKDVNVGNSSVNITRASNGSEFTEINGLALGNENANILNNSGVINVNLNNDPFISHTVMNPPITTVSCIQRNPNSKTKGSTKNKQVKTQSAQNSNGVVPCNKTCTRCGKKFAKPSLLARHMRIHTGEKPYHCSVCTRTFSQRSSLDAHSYTHTNERPFICEMCPFRTVQKAALKKHCSRAHPQMAWLSTKKTNNSKQRQLQQPSNIINAHPIIEIQ